MNSKKINELENYDITKATENDVIPVVETKDGTNETKKLPVTTLRDMMAKFNLQNLVTFVNGIIAALKNEDEAGLKTQIKRLLGNFGELAEGEKTPGQIIEMLAHAAGQLGDEDFQTLMDVFGFGDAEDMSELKTKWAEMELGEETVNATWKDWTGLMLARFVGGNSGKESEKEELKDRKLTLEKEDCRVVQHELAVTGTSLDENTTISVPSPSEGTPTWAECFVEAGGFAMQAYVPYVNGQPDMANVVARELSNKNDTELRWQPVVDANGFISGVTINASNTVWNESSDEMTIVLKRKYTVEKKLDSLLSQPENESENENENSEPSPL